MREMYIVVQVWDGGSPVGLPLITTFSHDTANTLKYVCNYASQTCVSE